MSKAIQTDKDIKKELRDLYDGSGSMDCVRKHLQETAPNGYDISHDGSLIVVRFDNLLVVAEGSISFYDLKETT